MLVFITIALNNLAALNGGIVIALVKRAYARICRFIIIKPQTGVFYYFTTNKILSWQVKYTLSKLPVASETRYLII